VFKAGNRNLVLLKDNDREFYRGLKWLITFRAVFGIVLLASGLLSKSAQTPSMNLMAFGFVFIISVLVIVVSIVYAVILPRVKNGIFFAYLQIITDSFLITLIIFATGGPDSFFHFLYLLVIMYSSLLIGRKAAIIVAALSSIEYSILIIAETSSLMDFIGSMFYYRKNTAEIFYKIASSVSACFLMAFLGSVLADQAKKAKKDLKAIEIHLKRVEKLAFAGEMAAGLAHEIKNPLAALSGSVQILQDEISESSENYRLIQIITRETERLNNLVSSFLSLSIQKQGESARVNVAETIKDVVDLFRKDCKAQCIDFIININADCHIMIDPGHLRQVMWNLIQNAADSFSGKQNGKIDISCGIASDKRVVITVRDNGSGMSSETISSIFTPFFTTKQSGNGLGLCIVHRILENYDARIDVSSREGSGTEFMILFRKE
jgi:two-component system sensor histidine kinase PilS (NtrC family)